MTATKPKPVIAFWENRGTPVFDDEAPNGQIIGYDDITHGTAVFPSAEAAYDHFDPETMRTLSVKAIEDLPPLFAAAPDLLEAVKGTESALDCLLADVVAGRAHLISKEALGGIVRDLTEARAAIAKAAVSDTTTRAGIHEF